jgi:hypothetical protein
VTQTLPGDETRPVVTTTATIKTAGQRITAPIVTTGGDCISAGQTANFQFCHRFALPEDQEPAA